MDPFETKTINKEHIQFHFVPTTKFKTITIVAKFKAPLSRDTVTKRALLSSVLKRGTKHYPSEMALQKKLDELYGAVLYMTTAKKGSHHIVHFQLEIANDKFIEQATNVTEEALQLLQEVIFSPHMENNKFPADIIEREKRRLENKIESIYDQKIAYANERMIDEMFENERFSIHSDGYVEDLPSIDHENLTAYYEEMITKDALDIYVLGDFQIETMQSKVTSLFQRKAPVHHVISNETEASSKRKEPKRIIETDSIHQAKLHMGYRTNIVYKDEAYSALQVFNGLFGAFPNSKLFVNVREKHSLAYYIASRIESHAGLLLVYSGVENSEYERTSSIIEAQLEAIRQGDFTEAELANVKDLLTSNIKETLDHPGGTIELLYQQVVGDKLLSPATLMNEINRVTKEEVIEVAKQINLDTIYVLAGEVDE